MSRLPLEREAILPRIDGIRKNLERLERLGKLPLKKFSAGDDFDLVQHHLRLALEGVFHIGSHILSRAPGGRADQYKEIAIKLCELGIVDKKFASTKLVKMAGLRNLLVHQYADIEAKQLYQIVVLFHFQTDHPFPLIQRPHTSTYRQYIPKAVPV